MTDEVCPLRLRWVRKNVRAVCSVQPRRHVSFCAKNIKPKGKNIKPKGKNIKPKGKNIKSKGKNIKSKDKNIKFKK